MFIEAFEPSMVVLVCGENDIANGYDVSSTFDVFSTVVDQYIAGGARVLYIGTKPEPGTTGYHTKYQQYDSYIWDLAANKSGDGLPPLVMIDSYSGFEAIGNADSLYDSDELHLSAEGYSYWTQWAKTALNATGDDANCYAWRSGVCNTTSSSAPSNTSGGVRSDVMMLLAAYCGWLVLFLC